MISRAVTETVAVIMILMVLMYNATKLLDLPVLFLDESHLRLKVGASIAVQSTTHAQCIREWSALFEIFSGSNPF